MKKIKVLHVVAHLGGGVGRVLSSVAKLRRESGSDIEETFFCLEPPEKRQYLDVLQHAHVPVVFPEDGQSLDALIKAADIVQIEWWHHPVILAWMTGLPELDARLVIWCHTSGLHFPIIPAVLVGMPHAFLFTSPLSPGATGVRLQEGLSDRENIVRVVHSSGGFGDFPSVHREPSLKPLNYGYLGALNFVKLHPDILKFIQAVDIPEFSVDFFGDPSSNPELMQRCADWNLSEQMRVCGFTERPDRVLQEMDVFVYLLNPLHYGSTENALLEAMACGVVPVVLNNPVESTIVRHQETGLVVDGPKAFSEAIAFLHHHPQERLRMSNAAAREMRSRFALEVTERRLTECYQDVIVLDKKTLDFRPVFGTMPADWFLSCAGRYASYFTDEAEPTRQVGDLPYPYLLYEKSKGSVFHFLKYFPDDRQLRRWAHILEANGRAVD